MKTSEKKTEKRLYNSPEIVCIELDNEISLVLESNPPFGPDEVAQSVEQNNNNPFKNSESLV